MATRALVKEKGIISLPGTKQGKTISSKIRQSVELFYEDSEYSRLMPGAKDYMSLSARVH